MPRPALPRRRLPAGLALVLSCGLASGAALALPDRDDPPPLTPIRDPAPVEPAPLQLVLAAATPRLLPGAVPAHPLAPATPPRPAQG